MTDQLAGPDADGASAPAPAGLSPDIEKIIEDRVAAALEPRIKGFQKLVSARDEELGVLRDALENERLAGLSEDERADILESKKDKRIEELEAQLELNKLSGSYGEEMPFFQGLLAAESAEDQLKLMREYADSRLAQANPAPAPAAEPVVNVPDVDLNRPMRPAAAQGTRLPDGTLMTEAEADRILGAHQGPTAAVTQWRLRSTD